TIPASSEIHPLSLHDALPILIEVAFAAKEVLDKAKITGYCKTSGSTGLHIYIPLEAKYSYEEGRDFTKLLCYFIHEMLPDTTSRSEEHTSELQSRENLVCRLL